MLTRSSIVVALGCLAPLALPAHAASDVVLYSFKGGSDGSQPFGGLIYAGNYLWGTTGYGDSAACSGGGGGGGCGTVFRLTTAGAEKTIYPFQTGTDGKFPYVGNLVYVGGKFYGTTSEGGTANDGIVFSVTPGGTEKILYSFQGYNDAARPYSGLTYVNGTFYGTTQQGGPKNWGTVFSITPAGAEKVIYAFQGGADGGEPTGALTYSGGLLYGTTLAAGATGAGTVFTVTPAGVEKPLYSFAGGNDGIKPFLGGLLKVGNYFYGTTWKGGNSTCDSGCGTIFRINAAGDETAIYSFQGGTDGEAPWAGLTKVVTSANKTVLYGTTTAGGANGLGTIYSVTLAGKESVVYSFKGGADGSGPYGGTLLNQGGVLYGMTANGGASNLGTVYSLTP